MHAMDFEYFLTVTAVCMLVSAMTFFCGRSLLGGILFSLGTFSFLLGVLVAVALVTGLGLGDTWVVYPPDVTWQGWLWPIGLWTFPLVLLGLKLTLPGRGKPEPTGFWLKRRRYQFSLRVLFVIVTLAAVVAASGIPLSQIVATVLLVLLLAIVVVIIPLTTMLCGLFAFGTLLMKFMPFRCPHCGARIKDPRWPCLKCGV
jgi:hypothetical protein